MASSRVMASSSSANSDLARQSSIYSLTIAELQSSVSGDPAKNFGSLNMDDFLRNICAENAGAYGGGREPEGGGGVPPLSRQGSFSLPKGVGDKTVDEVWKEISEGRKVDVGDGSGYKDFAAACGEMTLEDYLARSGTVRPDNVRGPLGSVEGFGVESVMNDRFGQQQQHQTQLPLENSILGFGNGVEGTGSGASGGGARGRGRKRSALDPVDRAALQRQKRMIKNRESAARSRERKQAYTVELETLVTQLEEENARLHREQEELNKARLKQLMENLIPVTETERKKPPRALRRTQSM